MARLSPAWRGWSQGGRQPGGAWIRCWEGASTQAVQGAGLEPGHPPFPSCARVLPRRETQGRGQPRPPRPRAEPSTTQVSGREVGGRLSTAYQKQEGNESVQ